MILKSYSAPGIRARRQVDNLAHPVVGAGDVTADDAGQANALGLADAEVGVIPCYNELTCLVT